MGSFTNPEGKGAQPLRRGSSCAATLTRTGKERKALAGEEHVHQLLARGRLHARECCQHQRARATGKLVKMKEKDAVAEQVVDQHPVEKEDKEDIQDEDEDLVDVEDGCVMSVLAAADSSSGCSRA